MTRHSIELRITGDRADCGEFLRELRERYPISNITGPVLARYSWPKVHVLATAWLDAPEGGAVGDDRI